MSEKDPAFLFYSKDWLEGTADMSISEKGVYIDLLAYQHQRGFIPEDTKRIATLVGLSEEEFLKYWVFIKDKFAKQEQGKLVNKKLSKVASDRSEYAQMRTILGTFGGMLRALETSEKNKSKLKKLFSYTEFLAVKSEDLSARLAVWLANSLTKTKQSLEDEDEIEDLNIIKTFTDFWNVYPKKKSKGDAEKAWDVIKPSQELIQQMIDSVGKLKLSSQWVRDNGQYIPFPATWLRAKGWLDAPDVEVDQSKLMITPEQKNELYNK